MQTRFSPQQLADPDIQVADDILRTCVHCGFCTATCPTYVLKGDELDSPRGRIYLIKDMLEGQKPASAPVATHIDRCLSCLSCMTTCPSGVDYMHLIDLARTRVEETHRRPFPERAMRALLGIVLPRPALFRMALRLAALARPFKTLLPARLRPALEMAPARLPARGALKAMPGQAQIFPAEGPPLKRVALMAGCAQQVLAPAIDEATIRLLTRHGVEVVVAKGAGCCGALQHHLGQHAGFSKAAKRNIAAWSAEAKARGLDAIIVNASGCGTVVKDYGFLFRNDETWRAGAQDVSRLTQDIAQFMSTLPLKPSPHVATGQTVAYHSACSMQHGQRLRDEPKALLAAAGFRVRDIPEGHLCCGSAGTYNLLQSEMAGRLRRRKLDHIALTAPHAVATGNIGCIAQLQNGANVPVLHTVELLDWATGGPLPPALKDSADF